MTETVFEANRLTGFAVVERECGETWRNDHARLAERQFRLLFEGVTLYAILMLDLEGRVTSSNPRVAAIEGYAPDEIIGRHFSIFYSPLDRGSGRPDETLRCAREHGRHQAEGWRYRRDGTAFWATVIVMPIRERGHLIGYAQITRDMTRHKEHENEILKAKRTAEHRYRESRSMSAFLDNVIGNIPIRVLVEDSQTGQILMDNAARSASSTAPTIDAGTIVRRLRGPAAKTLDDDEIREMRIGIDTGDGTVRLKCRVLRVNEDVAGGAANLMYLVEDITGEYRAHEKIHFMTHLPIAPCSTSV